MKIGRLFPDLLATLGGVASSEAGFARTLKRLVVLSGARAGALRFRPGEAAPVDLVVGTRPGSARASRRLICRRAIWVNRNGAAKQTA